VIALEVTPGELLDRLTILEIKLQRQPPGDPQARLIAGALNRARAGWRAAGIRADGVRARIRELRTINAALWNAEDEIRSRTERRDFGNRFISVARAICRLNDRRSSVKRAIDELCGVAAWDTKRYASGRRPSKDSTH
jgi:hypothetical protein